MSGVDATLIILVLTFGAAMAGRRLRTPLPVTLTIAGLGLGIVWGLVPGLPRISLPPEYVLLIFLPPLLTSAAYTLPLGAFRRNILPIGLMSVVLVVLTMVVAGAVGHVVIGLPWPAALLLGAIVAPPDPVAATTVGGSTGLPHRLVVVLEGEGLLNDAVAIVAYALALSAAVSGEFTWSHAAMLTVKESLIGAAVGLGVGVAFSFVRRRLEDVTIEAGISVLTPFLTYQLADRLGASGVLAVVSLGFVLQHNALQLGSPVTRLAARTVWAAVRFFSVVLVFLFVGLMLGLTFVTTHVRWKEVGAGLVIAFAVIALRFAWMALVPRMVAAKRRNGRRLLPSRGERAVLAWSGMRGVVSLALALALPELPATGDLNTRHAIIIATFTVIGITLLVQGLTILPLIERLGVGDPGRSERDERKARARASWAASAMLDRLEGEGKIAPDARAALDRELGAGRLGVSRDCWHPRPGSEADAVTALIGIQRRVVQQLRYRGRIGEALTERLVTTLDVDEARVRDMMARLTGSVEDD